MGPRDVAGARLVPATARCGCRTAHPAGRRRPRTGVHQSGVARFLGLNPQSAIAAAIAGAFERWGVGACGVPVLTGMSAVQRELETEMSAALGREDAMVFPSGFSGGVGMMLALLRAGDVAIADAKAHMCWLDGIRSTGAQ